MCWKPDQTAGKSTNKKITTRLDPPALLKQMAIVHYPLRLGFSGENNGKLILLAVDARKARTARSHEAVYVLPCFL